jgi:hypothetical protein
VNESFLVNNVMAGAALINGVVFVVSTFINMTTYLPKETAISYMGSLLTSASLLLKEVCKVYGVVINIIIVSFYVV